MKSMNVRKFLLFLIFATALGFTACGGDSSDDGGGVTDPYAGLAAGLYSGDPLSGGTLIGTVTANDVAAAVSYVNTNPGAYTLVIDADVSAGPQTLGVANRQLTIIGIGVERQIGLSGTGALFTVGAASQAGISLTLGNNITLVGVAGNNNSVVYIQNAAAFTMLNGSKITGNAYSGTGRGGGVTVASGNFTMEGGEISGNTVTTTTIGINSGGVMVNGTFIMKGGKISGNTATGTGNNSGGVFVASSAFFRMVSGTIYGDDNPDTTLKNNCTNGASLYRANSNTAQYGTYTGPSDSWVSNGELATFSGTIWVIDGVLQQVPLAGTVSIAGGGSPLRYGDTLTASYAGGYGSGTASWQWLRGTTAIPGATSATYTVAFEDEGSALTARVSYANQSGYVENASGIVTAYAIGDTGPGGGKIFHRGTFTMTDDSSTAHYLEAATSDQATNRTWSSSYINVTGANGAVIGTGRANTAAIKTAHSGENTANNAAWAANITIGGKSDWFLPSRMELNALYLVRSQDIAFFPQTATYWSSTNNNQNNAYYYDFTSGNNTTPGMKNVTYNVRAIRAF